MPVKYIVKKQYNFVNPEQPRYTAQWKSRGEMNIRDIAEELSHASTLTPPDVAAMMEGLIHVLGHSLAHGYLVKLGDFGSFSLSLDAEAQPLEKDVDAATINGCRVNFRPGKALKKIINDVSYSKK